MYSQDWFEHALHPFSSPQHWSETCRCKTQHSSYLNTASLHFHARHFSTCSERLGLIWPSLTFFYPSQFIIIFSLMMMMMFLLFIEILLGRLMLTHRSDVAPVDLGEQIEWMNSQCVPSLSQNQPQFIGLWGCSRPGCTGHVRQEETWYRRMSGYQMRWKRCCALARVRWAFRLFGDLNWMNQIWSAAAVFPSPDSGILPVFSWASSPLIGLHASFFFSFSFPFWIAIKMFVFSSDTPQESLLLATFSASSSSSSPVSD